MEHLDVRDLLEFFSIKQTGEKLMIIGDRRARGERKNRMFQMRSPEKNPGCRHERSEVGICRFRNPDSFPPCKGNPAASIAKRLIAAQAASAEINLLAFRDIEFDG